MNNKIILCCVKCQSRNYSTYNNKGNTNERLEVKKYCKHCNAHTDHRETK